MFHSTGGENWKRKDRWVTNTSFSLWYGIMVNDRHRVVELDLCRNSLQGICTHRPVLRTHVCCLAPTTSSISSDQRSLHTLNSKRNAPLHEVFGVLGLRSTPGAHIRRSVYSCIVATSKPVGSQWPAWTTHLCFFRNHNGGLSDRERERESS